MNARGGRERGAWVTRHVASCRDEHRRGQDLVLTIDASADTFGQELGQTPKGAAVVMDVQTGDVLGIASKPSFDPNQWSECLTRAVKSAIDSNPYNPMLDKAVHAYFPGSVYKVVTAFAGLDRGILDPRARVSSPGAYEFENEFSIITSAPGMTDLATARRVRGCLFLQTRRSPRD